MALLLHQRLSPQIVNAIFSVHFLDKLDYEVASCYSKVQSYTSLTSARWAKFWNYLDYLSTWIHLEIEALENFLEFFFQFVFWTVFFVSF